MTTAVPVSRSRAGRKTVTVGLVTLVIHLASFVGASDGARTRSGLMPPSSSGTAPGQSGSTGGSPALVAGKARRSQTSRLNKAAERVGLRMGKRAVDAEAGEGNRTGCRAPNEATPG
jgi:hypothetical protein